MEPLYCVCVFSGQPWVVCITAKNTKVSLKVLLLLKLIFFSVLSLCPERIGMCINSFKSYVKYSHKVE